MELSYKANLVLRKSTNVTEKEYASIIGKTANEVYNNINNYSLADIYGMFVTSKEHSDNLDSILAKTS